MSFLAQLVGRSDDAWDPNRFANDSVVDVDYRYDLPLSPITVPMAQLSRELPPTYTDYYHGDAAQRRQVLVTPNAQSPQSGYYAPKPIPVFDIQTNPVEYLDTRLPLPGLPSPVREVTGNVLLGMQNVLPLENDLCCVDDIPSKELRQVRENLGAEMADRSRWGRGAGSGVAADLTVAPESGTQQVQHGPVAVSAPLYSNALYDQGFISMSAVPAVHAGKYKDPITGVEYDAYESAMPPPDDDYEETLNSSGRNVKLAHLQGGWRDTTPRPTKREVVEDDFHMQYDRTINTYGTYDPSRYIETIERNNRFTQDDMHPDPDGPELVGVPANFDGNQNTKIRYVPYMTPTNRGKWAETTFRDGIDPSVAVGNSEMMVAQTYTRFPCARMESTRQDGGGVEATQEHLGFMDTQMGDGQRDIIDTQRSTSEHRMPNMGPADYVRLNSNVGMEDYAAPTGVRGTEFLDEQYGAHGATGHGQQLQDADVAAPTGLSGTQVYDEAYGAYGATGYGQQLHDADVAPPTGLSGTQVYDEAYGAYGATGYGQQLYDADVAPPTGLAGTQMISLNEIGAIQPSGGDGSGGINATAYPLRTEQIPLQHKLTGLNTVGVDRFGASQTQNSFAQKLTEGHVDNIISKSGVINRYETYGSHGVSDHGQQLQNQSVENQTSKSGVINHYETYGSHGVSDHGQQLQNQAVENHNSKSGVINRYETYGSHGVSDHGQQLQNQAVENHNSKSGTVNPYETFGSHGVNDHGEQLTPGHYGAQQKTKREMLQAIQTAFDTTYNHNTAAPNWATRTRMNDKKGPMVDFMMPSASLGGTESTVHGSQTVGMSTSLNTKKEAQYNNQWGFDMQSPDSTGVWYGHYKQTQERQNYRPFGNFVHAVAPASSTYFMQQRSCET